MRSSITTAFLFHLILQQVTTVVALAPRPYEPLENPGYGCEPGSHIDAGCLVSSPASWWETTPVVSTRKSSFDQPLFPATTASAGPKWTTASLKPGQTSSLTVGMSHGLGYPSQSWPVEPQTWQRSGSSAIRASTTCSTASSTPPTIPSTTSTFDPTSTWRSTTKLVTPSSTSTHFTTTTISTGVHSTVSVDPESSTTRGVTSTTSATTTTLSVSSTGNLTTRTTSSTSTSGAIKSSISSVTTRSTSTRTTSSLSTSTRTKSTLITTTARSTTTTTTTTTGTTTPTPSTSTTTPTPSTSTTTPRTSTSTTTTRSTTTTTTTTTTTSTTPLITGGCNPTGPQPTFILAASDSGTSVDGKYAVLEQGNYDVDFNANQTAATPFTFDSACDLVGYNGWLAEQTNGTVVTALYWGPAAYAEEENQVFATCDIVNNALQCTMQNNTYLFVCSNGILYLGNFVQIGCDLVTLTPIYQ